VTLHWKLRQGVLPLVFLAVVFLVATAYVRGSAAASSNEGQQIGTILSVRKVLGKHYFVSRYPQIHYYMLYIAVQISDQTYCAGYETPVLDEIDDVFSAKGKDVEVVLKEKRLTVRTPGGRELKARLVEAKQC
jgi:hypothetical protein